MRDMRGGTGFASRWVVLGLMVFLGACGGSRPAPPPPPAGPSQPITPPEGGIEMVRTDVEPGQIAPPMVFGVDLDTVRAGRFDQGKMWTFEFPPVDFITQEYGFRPDEAWFQKARLGALRIPSCSASFVSSDGLVLTNHHCAREFVTQVQRDGENLLDDGFYAQDLSDERAVEDFEADQLIEIIDVTDEVNARVDAVPTGQRGDVRQEVLDEIEERLTEERGGEDSGFVVEMVSLYNGGRTSAYVFRRYTEAKLVMAPELQIGFFGGDPDNFTYPRYNLDFSFFRIYDDGEPLKSDVYFSVDDDGLEEGDAVFIVGNPGSTSRLQTVAELEFRRDVSDRYVLDLLRSRMAVLDEFIRSHPEEAEERDLRNEYFSLSNSEKAISGQVRGLEDPVLIARRRDTERSFQEAIEADPVLAERYGDLIDEMASVQESKMEQAPGFGAFLAMTSESLASATLYRGLMAFQVLSARMGGAPDEQIEELLEVVGSIPQQPAELDEALMAARFQDFIDFYGPDSDLAQAVLQGRSPEGAASVIRAGSALADSAGALAALQDGTLGMEDPALGVVRAYLPQFGAFQQTIGQVFPEEERIAAELGRARFEVYGTDVPPDATFSLRIADGVVSGYPYNGTLAPWRTTFFGLYDRHHSHAGDEDWDLPDRWLSPPEAFDLSTPLNFVSTVDIIGGNSGSPVLDRELEVVGVVFDGNVESLPGDYIFLPELNRSVTVDIRAILQALDHIYDMDHIAAELRAGSLAPAGVGSGSGQGGG